MIPKSEEEEEEGEEKEEVDGAKMQVAETQSKKSTSSIGGASFNFINSIIGSGIIG